MGLTVPFVLAGRPEAFCSLPAGGCRRDVLGWSPTKRVVCDRPPIMSSSNEWTILRDRMLREQNAPSQRSVQDSVGQARPADSPE